MYMIHNLISFYWNFIEIHLVQLPGHNIYLKSTYYSNFYHDILILSFRETIFFFIRISPYEIE